MVPPTGLDKGLLNKRLYGQSPKEVSMDKPADLTFSFLPLRRKP
jgi:hypothetical protein